MTAATTTDSEAEHGARLTCHILLVLFQSTRMLASTASTVKQLEIRCDRLLLDAAHEACEIGAYVCVLAFTLIEITVNCGVQMVT